MPTELPGAEILVEALVDLGVEVVFGYPGGAVLPIYDALFKQKRIKHILVRAEAGAAHAAEGYARSTGKPGVVLVTSGPGATTLPMELFSKVRLGLSPEINALATIIVAAVALALTVTHWSMQRRKTQG